VVKTNLNKSSCLITCDTRLKIAIALCFSPDIGNCSFLVINVYLSNITFIISGAKCPPAVPLDFDNAQENICKKLRGENPWRQIKCLRFKTERSRQQFKTCSKWCKLFACCFNENATACWVKHCSAMFRRPSPSHIIVAGNNASFHVHPCPGRNEYAVRVASCNCSEDSSDTRK